MTYSLFSPRHQLFDVSQQEINGSSMIIPWNATTWILMAAAVFVALFILVLVAWVVFRYRARPGEGDAPQVHGNTKLEITWTAIPVALVLAIFAFGIYTQFTAATSAGKPIPKGRKPDIVVIGHQFWWEFRYPAYGIVTANEFHIPANKDILIQLESDDVIHDLWIPQLGEKMDNVPGITNHEWFYSTKPGIYEGACAEYCGAEHAWMRPIAVVDTSADFQKWVRDQKTIAIQPQTDEQKLGKKLFLSNTCVDCHSIAGTPANADVGPDLTHVGSRKQIGAGVLPNTPENLYKFLKNPQEVKPGILMPDFHLSDQEAHALTAYLESLK